MFFYMPLCVSFQLLSISIFAGVIFCTRAPCQGFHIISLIRLHLSSASEIPITISAKSTQCHEKSTCLHSNCRKCQFSGVCHLRKEWWNLQKIWWIVPPGVCKIYQHLRIVASVWAGRFNRHLILFKFLQQTGLPLKKVCISLTRDAILSVYSACENCPNLPVFLLPPCSPPPPSIWGVYWNHLVRLSLRLSVVLAQCPIRSAHYLLNRATFFLSFFTKFGIVVYHLEAMSHVENLVHYLHCQGHSKGVYNQN